MVSSNITLQTFVVTQILSLASPKIFVDNLSRRDVKLLLSAKKEWAQLNPSIKAALIQEIILNLQVSVSDVGAVMNSD